MSDLVQHLVIAVAVLLAALWLGRRTLRAVRGGKSGCGCGKGACPATKQPKL